MYIILYVCGEDDDEFIRIVPNLFDIRIEFDTVDNESYYLKSIYKKQESKESIIKSLDLNYSTFTDDTYLEAKLYESSYPSLKNKIISIGATEVLTIKKYLTYTVDPIPRLIIEKFYNFSFKINNIDTTELNTTNIKKEIEEVTNKINSMYESMLILHDKIMGYRELIRTIEEVQKYTNTKFNELSTDILFMDDKLGIEIMNSIYKPMDVIKKLEAKITAGIFKCELDYIKCVNIMTKFLGEYNAINMEDII